MEDPFLKPENIVLQTTVGPVQANSIAEFIFKLALHEEKYGKGTYTKEDLYKALNVENNPNMDG